MSDKTTITAPDTAADLAIGQRVALQPDHPSEFAGLRGQVVNTPSGDNTEAAIEIDYPGHQLHGWTVAVTPDVLVTSGKLLDARYLHGLSEIDDDLSDDDWFRTMGPSDELVSEWNRESITGGLASDATANATVDGVRVIAVYVEDDQSDEFARMFECFWFDGTVDYVSEDDIEIDDESESA